MLKVGIEVLKKDFCVQIGYNRRAVKNYSDVSSEAFGQRPQGTEVSTPQEPSSNELEQTEAS